MDINLLLLQLLKNGEIEVDTSTSSVEILDARPFYRMFMNILDQYQSNGFEASRGDYVFYVGDSELSDYAISQDDGLYTLFDDIYTRAQNSLQSDDTKPAEINFNKKVFAIYPQGYGSELSAPVILDNFIIGQYYNGRDSIFEFGSYVSCHLHFLSNYSGCGVFGVVDGILTYSRFAQEEGPDTITFTLDTNFGVCNLSYTAPMM